MDDFTELRKDKDYNKLVDVISELVDVGITTAELIYFIEAIKHEILEQELADDDE